MGNTQEKNGRSIRVLIVDDHALFRESVARMLAAESGLDVVASCGSAHEGLIVLGSKSVDVVLLDVDFGRADECMTFVLTADRMRFNGKILLVTAGLQDKEAGELIRRGIAGIFLKHNPPAQLLEAIHSVAQGKVWLSQHYLEVAATGLTDPAEAPGRSPITQRQRQVLAYVFEGLPNREIAKEMGISETAVKSTLQQLFSKTGVRTRGQLVRVAMERYKDLL